MRRLSRALTGAGIEAAGGDARRLLAAAIDADAAELIRDPGLELSAEQVRRLNHFLTRRLMREPVARNQFGCDGTHLMTSEDTND